MSTTPVSPLDALRRSQIYRWHLANDARFGLRAGRVTVEAYADPATEKQRAGHLGLADLSTAPRLGLRGADCAQWLSDQGWRVPAAPNQAATQDDGCLLARLSATEFLLLADAGLLGASITGLATRLAQDDKGLVVLPREDSHCHFILTGVCAPDTLAKLCGVDLRPRSFAPGAVAQTSVARINAVLIRAGTAAMPVFHLFCDASMAEYFWTTMLDAMQEYDGAAIGVAALAPPGESA